MALILGIETGTDVCSVSLSRNGQCIALRESSGGNDHARNLATFIDEIIRSNEYSPSQLDAVSVGMGPGSYTGLRIGVSTAKGICYSLGIPLIAVSSLEALACVAQDDYQAGIIDIDHWDSALLCPMIDARRMEVYAQVFDSSLAPLSPVGAHIVDSESFGEFITPDRRFVIFGNGARKCADVLPKEGVALVDVIPSARGLSGPAYEAFRAGKFEDIAYFEPYYLKDFIVTESKKKFF